MRSADSRGVLFSAAIVLLALSFVSLLVVGERAIAALWQWYKFYGYETPGVITLSKQTGVLFAVFMVVLALACFTVKRAGERSDARAEKLSRMALVLVCVGIVLYCGLAFSPLNVWRP